MDTGNIAGNIGEEIGRRVSEAVARALDVRIGVDEALVRHAAAEHGDYQSNVALSLARRVGQPPRQVAERIVGALDVEPLLAPPRVAGPGFVNLTLRREWLDAHAGRLLGDERLGVPRHATPRRVVIDYSSPNMAKEMHVGHLRSTIIGDCLARLWAFLGDGVVRQNHLGDWGTPFGMLVEHLIDEGMGEADHLTVADLNTFYQRARAKFDADPSFADRARRRVVLLQSGDEATLALWRRLAEESKRHIQAVYDLLGVQLTPEDDCPESFYNPVLAEIGEELTRAGLAEISDGALCAFPEGFRNREGGRMALIVRKSDGGYTYDTTDLATIRYRARELHGDDLVYVVGSPQRLHFEMVFAVARAAGWVTAGQATTYVGFGSVLGENGRMLQTRRGESVSLVDLLDGAVGRAAGLLAERSELHGDEAARLARAIGVGAVKYADLSGDREKDYVFSLDRMLAMDGNTSVYLQYANARIRSILRRADDAAEGPIAVGHPAERRLLLGLARFPEAVDQTMRTLEPHRLCTYLFDTAVAFTSFYEHCPVLNADGEAARASRLALCSLTSRVLTTGLGLLGIEAPDRL